MLSIGWSEQLYLWKTSSSQSDTSIGAIVYRVNIYRVSRPLLITNSLSVFSLLGLKSHQQADRIIPSARNHFVYIHGPRCHWPIDTNHLTFSSTDISKPHCYELWKCLWIRFWQSPDVRTSQEMSRQCNERDAILFGSWVEGRTSSGEFVSKNTTMFLK